MARESISKKLRFEVFKRDSFTCQYCGAKAPDVILEIDHIKPVAKEGSSDILNLITACKDCNSGKSDRVLSDNSMLEKQRKQLSELQERKEQIEMMMEWQRELTKLDNFSIDQVATFWAELVPPFHLNNKGKRTLQKLLAKFSQADVMEAIRIAVNRYIKYEDNIPTQESIDYAWKKVGGICTLKRLDEKDPNIKELYYIRAILKNRLDYLDEGMTLNLLRKSVRLGASIDNLREFAIEVDSWTNWHIPMENFIYSRENRDDKDAGLNLSDKIEDYY